MEVNRTDRRRDVAGYKQTECGVVPEEWVVDTVGSFFELQNGVNADKAAYGTGVPFVNVLEVITHPQLTAAEIPGRVQLSRDALSAYRVEAGDVLFNRTSETQEEVGLASVYIGTEEVVFGGFVIRGHPRDREMNSSVVSLLLRTPAVRAQIVARGQGVVRANIGQTELGRVWIPIPPRAEQKAIAEALSDADALIESLSLLLAKKRQIKQGAMQELLTGKKRLPGFRDAWTRSQLGKLLSVRHGRSQRLVECDVGQYPILATGGRIGWANQFLHDKPSVLIGRKGTIDEPQFMDTPFWTVDTLFYTDIHFQNVAKFLFYRLCLVNWMRHNEASGVPSLSAKVIESIEIEHPDSDEQQAIADALSSMDAEIDGAEARLQKVRHVKQGMMQALLTGRIRLVKSASNIIPLPTKPAANLPTHNWQINEAVVIGVLAQRFGSEKFPLPRKRRVKLTYLLHRHAEGRAEGYLKKAAGPYDPNTKYKGPEQIALKNGYVRALRNEKYEGFVAGSKIEQAQRYFEQWYGDAALTWLERFHYRKTEELELLATVDMAMVDLAANGEPGDVASVKRVIAAHPEWLPKLSRELFSDERIAAAIAECQTLFGG